jgi:hypothetical protein
MAAVFLVAPTHGAAAQKLKIKSTGFGGVVDTAIAKARAATAPFRKLERAMEAGYPGTVTSCLDHQPLGGMGYHHVNSKLADDQLDVEHPEILVYAYMPNGEYKLNGVEYVVPYSAHSKDAEPPEIMGQKLKRADGLQLWYLHVWIWEDNKNGLFADWNPSVKCK